MGGSYEGVAGWQDADFLLITLLLFWVHSTASIDFCHYKCDTGANAG